MRYRQMDALQAESQLYDTKTLDLFFVFLRVLCG
jgi:hypothetical protein